MAKEKKKKTTPIIVEKPEIMSGVKPVQSSHFEPSWYKPAVLYDHSTASYYPSGQRVIEEKGQEYNYDNFVDNFGDRIHYGDLQTIENSDKNQLNVFRIFKESKYSIVNTLHHVFLALLTACVLELILYIPSYLLVQNGIEHIAIEFIMIFIPYALIILVISFIATIMLSELKIKFKFGLEASKLKQDEL